MHNYDVDPLPDIGPLLEELASMPLDFDHPFLTGEVQDIGLDLEDLQLLERSLDFHCPATPAPTLAPKKILASLTGPTKNPGAQRTTIRFPVALIKAFRARATALGLASYQRLMISTLQEAAASWSEGSRST